MLMVLVLVIAIIALGMDCIIAESRKALFFRSGV